MIYLFSVNFIVHKKMAEKINQMQQKNKIERIDTTIKTNSATTYSFALSSR